MQNMLERLQAHSFDPRINRRNLSFFYAAAVECNFTRAAKICGVAQPSLSRGIVLLEEAIGSQLFERVGRSVALSQKAEELLPDVELYLNQSMDFVERLTTRHHGTQTEVKVAAISSLTADLLPEIIGRFEDSNPHISITLLDGINQEIIDAVNVGDVDMGIVATPEDPEKFRTKLLFKDRYYLAVNRKHRFAKRSTVRWEDLASEKIATFRKGSSTYDTVERTLNSLGVHFNPVARVNYRSTLMGLVAYRGSVTILPRLAIGRCENGPVCAVPLVDPIVDRSYYQVTRKGRLRSREAEVLGNHLRMELMKIDSAVGAST